MSKKLFSNLIAWSNEQYSYLPWRKKRTLYRTLVSEIMLQQTTVGTVLNHFDKFMDKYPTIVDLAQATEEEVCISWKGLGYYRRARNLRNLAIQIVQKFEGKIPTNVDSLMELKGIGPYTSNALVAIGADQIGLAVDANLERVLARFYGDKTQKGAKLQKKLLSDFKNGFILSELNELGPRQLNEAFMDLGRILCQARKANCLLCPLKNECKAYKSGDALSYPVEDLKKEKKVFFIKLLRVVVKEKKKILLYQKKENEWLSGQWEVPTFILETNDETLGQYPRLKIQKKLNHSDSIKTSITKYSIENLIVEMSPTDFNQLIKKIDISYEFKIHNENLNLSTTSQKVLKRIATS